jgi:hypothetical protein
MSLLRAVAHYRITTKPGEGGILDFDAGKARFPIWINREGGTAEVVIEWT